MTAQLLDGQALAKTIQTALIQAVEQRLGQGLRAPALSVIMVGDDPASRLYVDKKRQMCEAIGFMSINHDLPRDIEETKLLTLIEQLNQDPTVDGILLQLPLPQSIDTTMVLNCIDPIKDVDGLNPYNIGLLAQKDPLLRPCTPMGITTLLEHYVGDLTGKHVVIVGTSNIVGRPMALEMIWQNCTVTVCHQYTENLAYFTQQADILISATGKVHLITADMIQSGAIVVDVGINRFPNGKLVGDVDFDSVKAKAAWITPVPGGVGPMTIVSLMQNTLLAAELHDDTE